MGAWPHGQEEIDDDHCAARLGQGPQAGAAMHQFHVFTKMSGSINSSSPWHGEDAQWKQICVRGEGVWH